MTIVASMSPNGLILLTSVSTTELSSVWVLYNPVHSPSLNYLAGCYSLSHWIIIHIANDPH